jgi:hypothetical protein
VVAAAATPARVTLDDVRFSGNANGLHARSGATVTATNSVFSGNSGAGDYTVSRESDERQRQWSPSRKRRWCRHIDC